MKNTFSKSEKLKSQKQIEQLFEKGKAITAFPLKLIYLKTNDENKVGVSVSKRIFSRAVDRNRIKRLLREAYRVNKKMLIDNNVDGYAFMILYLGDNLPEFGAVDRKVKELFNKLFERLL